MTKTTKTVYVTSDKQEFGSEAEAQAHEIALILPENFAMGNLGSMGACIVERKDAILSILGAKRRTRSDKGKSLKPSASRINAALQDMKQ